MRETYGRVIDAVDVSSLLTGCSQHFVYSRFINILSIDGRVVGPPNGLLRCT